MSSIKWAPGIGDPSWIGWLTTVSYFAAVWLCFDAFRSALPRMRRERIWLVLACGMLLLGVNKQLDLHTLMTEVGRQVAHEQGWFGQRRQVQAVFAAVIAIVSLASLASMFMFARKQRPELRLSLLGAVVLIGFVVMRSASFEHVGPRNVGDKFNAVIEISGIVCVALGAFLWRMRQKGGDLTRALESSQPGGRDS